MPEQQISKEQFCRMVASFLLTVEHELILVRGCRVSLFTARRWAAGISAPHPLGRPAVIQFMEEHLRFCVCDMK